MTSVSCDLYSFNKYPNHRESQHNKKVKLGTMKNQENRPGQGRNKQKRYGHTNRTFLLYVVQYFFANSDLDLPIDFFFVSILYRSKYSFAKYYVFSNNNDVDRGEGSRAAISKNVTDKTFLLYDSVADVPESRVWLRADFQSGSRVLKKVF